MPGESQCRPTKRPWTMRCSCSTTSSTSTATAICRALPTPRPTWWRRCCARRRKFSEEVLTPLNRVGDKEGCTRHADGSVTTPTGFKDAFKQLVEGGWIGISVPAEFGGQGLPATLTEVGQRIPLLGQHGLRHVSGPHAGRHRRAARACLAGAEDEISAEDGGGRMDRHHEPDRAALRHRSRPVAHQGGEAERRQLQDHRHQDLHLRRRARSGREHRPSGAGAHRRRARRHQGHLAVRGAEVHGQRRRLAWARATACPAARSKRRWASTAIPPA